MYKNRISRTSPKRHPQFFIRRSDITFDERLAFVESVCQSLVESRFGPGRVMPVIVNLSDRPEIEPAVFYDLCDDGQTGPCYSHSHLGRNVQARCLRSDKFFGTHDPLAKQMELWDAKPNALNSAAALTPNLGRGSP